MIINTSLYAEECSSTTYNPVTGELNIPSLIIEGDTSGLTYWASLLQRSGTLTFDYITHSANDTLACYQSTNTGATIDDSLADGDDEEFYTITSPSDSGGGYITVKLTFNNTDATPSLAAFGSTAPDVGAITTNSTDLGEDTPQVATSLFEAAPSQSYKIRVKEWFSPATYPINYTFTWSFTSNIDCYEPNNTAETSPEINLNSTIEAYVLGGYVSDSNNFTGGDERAEDWYQITLDTETNLTFELLQTPSNFRMSMVIREADSDSNIFSTVATSSGDLINTQMGTFQPGTYNILLEQHNTYEDEKVDSYPNKPIPDHYNTPYKFRIMTSN